jgi:hypothetical protein
MQGSSIVYSYGSLTLLGLKHLKICTYSEFMATLLGRDVGHIKLKLCEHSLLEAG